MLQSFHHLCGSLVNLSTCLWYWGAQIWTEHSPCGSPVLNRGISLDLPVTFFLVQSKMLLTLFAMWVHCCVIGNWRSTKAPWILFCKADYQLVIPQPVLMHGVIPLHMQDFALPFIECHEGLIGLFIQTVKIPLNSTTPTCCIGHHSQFYIICRPAEGALCLSLSLLINEDG